MRRGDFLEAGRAFHHRAALRRVALDVLAAHRTRIFELAHGCRKSISYSRVGGNVVFYGIARHFGVTFYADRRSLVGVQA
jgi:hypothetical protein